MPTYVYEVILAGGKPGRRFEVKQSIMDPPLTKDPKTGRPVRRIITTAPAFLQNRFDKTSKHFEKQDKREVEISVEKRQQKKRGRH